MYKVVPPVLEFIDHLTNWYIRRSRKRFWRPVDEKTVSDKASAYATLYETLVTFSKVLAPVLPFLSEGIYRHLVAEQDPNAKKSVHLCDFPLSNLEFIDSELEQQVALTRQVVSMGRALRERHKLKIRQPLKSLTLVHHDVSIRSSLTAQKDLIAEELNVKDVRIKDSDADLTTLSFKANFKTLGRRYGKNMKAAAQAISELTRDIWQKLSEGEGVVILDQEIQAEDVMVRRTAKADVVIETHEALVIALDTELTSELIAEGHAREATRRIQQYRKDSGLEISDRIHLTLFAQEEILANALNVHSERIAVDVLAVSVEVVQSDGGVHTDDVNGLSMGISIEKQ